MSKKKKKVLKRNKEKLKRRAQNNSIQEEDNVIWARDFIDSATKEKLIKVKNFSKDEIPPEIEAFCSLGPKACPVELDINSARLEGEINTFFRRLRLNELSKDSEDLRTDEEKRFYMISPQKLAEVLPLICSFMNSKENGTIGNLQGESKTTLPE